MTSQACPVCQSSQSRKLFAVLEGHLSRCAHCSLVYYTPLPTPLELAAFYDAESYRRHYHHSPLAGIEMAKARYQQLKTYLDQNTPEPVSSATQRRYLDIGCGEGDMLKVLAADGWDVMGTEISPKAAVQAGEDWCDRILVDDIYAINLPPASFDLITMYHLIEHLLDPVAILTRAYSWLKPGGVLFIETPNWNGLGARLRGKAWSLIIPPEHLTYFEPKSLTYALHKAGYKPIKAFSSAPPVIRSLEKLPIGARQLAAATYLLAPSLGMGANLQALAFRSS